MKNYFTCLTSVVLLLSCNLLFAVNAVDYDANSNEVIDVNEYQKYVKVVNSKPLVEFDKDEDGNLNAAELVAVESALSALAVEVEKWVQEFQIDYPDGQNIGDFASINKTDDMAIFASNKGIGKTKVLIRSSNEQITLTKNAKGINKASPAQISFSKDIKGNNEVMNLKGVVLRPIRFSEKTQVVLVPSLEFNQARNSNEEKTDIDSLLFRLGIDYELEDVITDRSYFRAGLQYSTDSDFDLDVRGIDLQYEPIALGWGQGAMKRVGKWSLKWGSIFLGEYGQVYDNANNESLIEDGSYARVGLKTHTVLWPNSIDRLSISLGYTYLKEVAGDLRDRKLFNASIGYDLDANGHYTLVTTYNNGDTSVALEDEESWTIGLGVKF